MKLDNRDLVLRGLLGILPAQLERYLRSALGDHCTPETLRALLDGNEPAPEVPDLADLSTQIRILAAHGADEGGLLDPPEGLQAALLQVRRFRDDALAGRPFDARRTRAALQTVGEILRLIQAEEGQEELAELAGSVDGGRAPASDPFDAVGVEVRYVPVFGYAHAVTGARPTASMRLTLAAGVAEPGLGTVDVTLTVVEDGGGREVVEPWNLSWDTSRTEMSVSRKLTLNRTNLAQVVQSGSAHVRVELRAADGRTTVRRFLGLTVLSPRQWKFVGGERWAGAALATFVQPEQPAVEALAAEALGLSGPADDSQEGAPGAERADALVGAAASALRRRSLRVNPTVGAWRAVPHLVRTAEDLLEAGEGTTLEVAVLLAGVLERLGVPATLMLTPDTALIAYGRDGSDVHPTSPQEAVDLIGGGRMGLVDPARAASSDVVRLDELDDEARGRALEAVRGVVLIVPLGTARTAGVSPQPELSRDEDGLVVELDAGPTGPLEAASAPLAAEAPQRAEADGDSAAPARVEVWKRSLLDLSLRNPLIDRGCAHAVEMEVAPELVPGFEDMVGSGDVITLLPADDAATPEERAALLNEQRRVRLAVGEAEFVRRLQLMTVTARTIIEETGANNLYLAVGTLTWSSDGRRLHSPLILIPVTLDRDGDSFAIAVDKDGAPTPNFSLLTRYGADTGIDLVELREPVRDEHGVDVEATLAALRARIEASGRDDAVEASVHLGLFRFSTYRMWRDLEDDWRTIADNPLVAHLLDESGAPFADPAGPLDADSDIDAIAQNLPLMADAAQARVVADAVEGRSLVVEGPPGTGKSQTVANIIFRTLATGRTVMFVAEKASALDVVARRLREEAGIGDLLLNLHDNGVSPLEVRQALSRALGLRVPGFDAAEAAGLRARLGELRGHLERYREGLHNQDGDAPSYYRARQALVGAREGDPAELERAREVFEARARDTGLASFDVAWYNDLLRDYRDVLGRLRTALTGELFDVVIARRDHVLDEAGARAEELREVISRRKGSLSIRDLMGTYGDLVTAITPCILVSPDSVARFLPVRSRYVDIVVFDEASQITVPDAVGPMGRGQTVVVVGDPQQMPPVPRAGGGEPAVTATQDRDSILDRCLDAGVARRCLTWHYRSRVESLIAFANKHYYDGALLSFPSPIALAAGPDDGPGGHGISLRRVDGRYYGADLREEHPEVVPNTNPVEADAIVAEVLRRFEASPDALPSIGVVTFNTRQRDLIEDRLRETGSERILEALETRDGLFVRDLENVQGEERDTILFSVTFSANERGDLPLNFGSLSEEGGERWLNVAITRARRQIVVFSSFDPEDLHAERSAHRGLRDLRAYLEQARDRRSPRALPASRSATDLHRNEIAEALRDAGLEVRVGVGHSAFEIDLVLAAQGDPERPEVPAVAVLLDGPGWNRRGGVTERDLMPADVLATMGWRRVERVWMPEWVADPGAVVSRLVDAVRAQPPSQEAAAGGPVTPAADTEGTPTRSSDYRVWQPEGALDAGLLERAETDPGARAQVIEIARAICDVESPLTRHRLVTTMSRALGDGDDPSREERIRRILGDDFAYIDERDFVWRTRDAALVPASYRRGALDHVDSIEEIHPRELTALMAEVRATSPEWSSVEELCTEALARLSTSKRPLSTPGVLPALTAALEEAERRRRR
ncbi:DUF4011 domain-containing protein [uncultured Actinomyces sp.]|uniref:DUF4011 domain-containing protein n=1 Tax=uncultured Actinomyces sp. TaxID=249061 RepID=UPI00288AFCBB|nr:DUF4011 domain-containing protein [uncultured Actinomyces sp.]